MVGRGVLPSRTAARPDCLLLCTGVFSSRKLERANYDSVAGRRRFLEQIETLFVQVLSVAGEINVLKLGTVALG
jgi:hypothetical protein